MSTPECVSCANIILVVCGGALEKECLKEILHSVSMKALAEKTAFFKEILLIYQLLDKIEGAPSVLDLVLLDHRREPGLHGNCQREVDRPGHSINYIYRCKICPKTYTWSDGLASHMNTHQGNPVKITIMTSSLGG